MQALPAPILKVDRLSKRFGGVQALDAVDFVLRPRELVGLIGPNGSGKTTAFNIVTGILKPSSGQISFNGRDVTNNRPETNAALGMARTFQNIRLFNDLPVIDNVMVGLHAKHGPGFLPTVLGLPKATRAEAEIRRRAIDVLGILGLTRRAKDRVGSLPYGDQRKVEFARALASEPSLLLLDEPTAGMNPYETADLAETIERLHRELDVTTLLVEHDMKMVMGICQRLVVINQGRLLAEGTPAEIRNDPRVVEAYLGHGRKARHAVG
jgi:branched-chain amino acid transport system ATP-binding protein